MSGPDRAAQARAEVRGRDVARLRAAAVICPELAAELAAVLDAMATLRRCSDDLPLEQQLRWSPLLVEALRVAAELTEARR